MKILTDDERPKLPETPYQLYYEWPDDEDGYGGSEVVDGDAYTAEQMEAYADAREAAVLAKLREQEPVAWHTEDHLDDRSATTYSKEAAQRWHGKGWPVTPLYAAPLPAVVQVPRGIDPDEADPVALWAEIARLQAAIQGPDGFNTWQEAAVHERQLRVKAERAAAPIEQDGESALTAEEQNRLDELLKHARWLMQSMPATDGLQHSWALNARDAMQRMHDWLKVYLPPAMPSTTARARDKT